MAITEITETITLKLNITLNFLQQTTLVSQGRLPIKRSNFDPRALCLFFVTGRRDDIRKRKKSPGIEIKSALDRNSPRLDVNANRKKFNAYVKILSVGTCDQITP